jgi:hypothetical protein
MKERFRNNGRRKPEMDEEFENGKKVNTRLADIAWQCIKSMTVGELNSNRQLFLDVLKPKNRGYILDTWKPTERRMMWCHIKFYPNLGR